MKHIVTPTLRRFISITVLLIFCVTGCASGPKTPEGEEGRDALVGKPLQPGIYHLPTGQWMTEESLFKALSAATFVLIGETHDDPWHHEIELRVYRAMVEQSSQPVALGLELFQTPFQTALTAYTRGEIDEDEMLTQTEYESRWGFDPGWYRPLWSYARKSQNSIVALNAPRELSRKVAQVGLEGLTSDEHAQVPEMDLENAEQREWFRKATEAHHPGMMEGEAFERFYQAQVLWDETMAESAYQFMREHPAVGQMVIIAGAGHVQNDFGIPNRLRRRIAQMGPLRAHSSPTKPLQSIQPQVVNEPTRGADVVTLIPLTLGATGAPTAEDHPPFNTAMLNALAQAEFADYIWVSEKQIYTN